MIRPLSQDSIRRKHDQFNERFMKPWLVTISTRKLPAFYCETIRSKPNYSTTHNKTSQHKQYQSPALTIIRPEQSIFDLGCKKYDSRYKQKMFIQVMKRLADLSKEYQNKSHHIQQLKQLARKCTTYFQINNLNNDLKVQNPNLDKIIKRFKIANLPGRVFDSRNKYHHYKLRQSLSLSQIKWNLINRNQLKRKNTNQIR